MSEIKIVIVDYGMGNIQSVHNALQHLGCSVVTSDDPKAIEGASALVLPGVGAFGEAVVNLKQRKLVEPIRDAVLNQGMPLLGICLGMQLLADESEERGSFRGLSLIPGQVKLIPVPVGFKLPHIGWNPISIRKSEPMFTDIQDGDAFYFVHSYHFECDPEHVTAVTNHGCDVVAAVEKGRIFATQFHPERSHICGLQLISNFVKFARKIKQSESAIQC